MVHKVWILILLDVRSGADFHKAFEEIFLISQLTSLTQAAHENILVELSVVAESQILKVMKSHYDVILQMR